MTSFFLHQSCDHNNNDNEDTTEKDEETTNTYEPMATAYYPIFDSFDNPETRQVVGVVSATFDWRNLLEGILPETSNGIRCVIENMCGTIMTWEINGMHSCHLEMGFVVPIEMPKRAGDRHPQVHHNALDEELNANCEGDRNVWRRPTTSLTMS